MLVAILVLAVSLALLAPRLFDLEGARRAITIQIEKRLGRRVTLGALSFRLLPTIEVRASEVKIAEDPAFDTGEFVTARTVRLEVGIWSLLRGSPQLRGLELDSPT
ncbi:MAG: AsmA family protein, partial [Acidobacteria bacterium]|nr:AsmA family protein [Acidobacteriota bacterium]